MRLDLDAARERLRAARVARLATVSGAGEPHLAPITFALDGDVLYFAVDHKPKASTDLRRLRNIQENHHVSVLVDHYADDWEALWWVRADGTAEVLPEERRGSALDLLASKYPQYASQRPQGPVVAIRVGALSGWSYRG